MAGSKVVVLGGGFGGASAAIRARQLLDPEHTVTLIDRQRESHLCGANPLIIVGAKDPDSATRSLEQLAEHGIELVFEQVKSIDTDRRQVRLAGGSSVEYDYLVVALGVHYDWEAVPGSSDAFSFYDHPSTLRLRDRLGELDEGTVVIGVAGTPYRCPPAPLEGAMMMDWSFRERGVRSRVDLHVCIPEPKPLGVAGPETASRVAAMLEERDISLHTDVTLTEVAEEGRLARLSDGSELSADVVVMVPRHRVPSVVADAGLTNGKPWVPVDRHTLETTVSGVFAVGDTNAIPIPPDKAVPKAGVFASGQGWLAAEQIAARITDGTPPDPYQGEGYCFLAFSGTETAQVGGRFLAEDGPEVTLGDPQPISAKEEWEADWRAFRI